MSWPSPCPDPCARSPRCWPRSRSAQAFCCWIWISPDYLSGLIRQARAKAIVVEQDMPLSTAAPNVVMADDACQAHAPPRPPLDADSLAYVTFTSGSTGTPKAVRG
ncbi:AMP-binding protein [Paracoccus marcusii]|uniref:AMP-binding protein n=1 Tax=Paracoccus marcusii TaxID=59779 RepID=UPI0039C88279